jgi:hypothetical protein
VALFVSAGGKGLVTLLYLFNTSDNEKKVQDAAV